jgi:glycosyltransferase involved in cell wall biosynthesis
MVDDASTDGTWDALQSRTVGGPFHFHPIRLPMRAGPGAARNVGWRAATAPVVAFTDDDCVPSNEWLAAIARAMVSADVAQGVTLADPTRVDRAGPWTEVVHLPHGTPFFETCNVAYRRDLLERLGGFDQRFRYAGEDVDLGQRAVEDRAACVFVGDAVVIHDVVVWSVRDRLRHIAERLGDSVQTVARHPGLRSILYRGVWYRRTHEPALLAVGGSLLVGSIREVPVPMRLAAAVLAAAPYVRLRFRAGRLDPSPTKNLLLVPVALFIDLSEIAVLARGSWRYRTLML